MAYGKAGQNSRIVNESSEDFSHSKIQIHAHGKLELSDDRDEAPEYYLRIGEDPQGHGSNGVSFFAANVLNAFKQPSGIITII